MVGEKLNYNSVCDMSGVMGDDDRERSPLHEQREMFESEDPRDKFKRKIRKSGVRGGVLSPGPLVSGSLFILSVLSQ